MNDADIAVAAHNAGIPTAQIPTAVAIALAESRGNPQSHNTVPPDNSYGLWQINMIDGLGPARAQQFGLASYNDLFDPNTNARAMAEISNGGTDWSAWTTYTSGAYRNYLDRGSSAARAAGQQQGWQYSAPVSSGGNPIADAINSALSPVGSAITQAETQAGNLFLGFGQIFAGVLLLLAGALVLSLIVVGRQPSVQAVAGAIPAGRALKAVRGAGAARTATTAASARAAAPKPPAPRGGRPRASQPRQTAKKAAEASGVRWSELSPAARARFSAAYRSRKR